LIHATAFFDVLRNLVRFEGYQIIVSTHDNEQAGFLRRKLDAVRIPWVDLPLNRARPRRDRCRGTFIGRVPRWTNGERIVTVFAARTASPIAPHAPLPLSAVQRIGTLASRRM